MEMMADGEQQLCPSCMELEMVDSNMVMEYEKSCKYCGRPILMSPSAPVVSGLDGSITWQALDVESKEIHRCSGGECNTCHKPIDWDAKVRQALGTTRPLNPDGTIHTHSPGDWLGIARVTADAVVTLSKKVEKKSRWLRRTTDSPKPSSNYWDEIEKQYRADEKFRRFIDDVRRRYIRDYYG